MGHSIERASGHSTSVPFCKGTQVDRFTNVLLFKEEERGGGLCLCQSIRPVHAGPKHTHTFIYTYESIQVLALAWSPSGDLLASGSLDKTIIIWPSQGPGSKRHTIADAHHGGVTCLLWEDGDSLLSAGYDCFIRKWNISRS